MKKISTIFVLMALVFMLVACGDSNDSSSYDEPVEEFAVLSEQEIEELLAELEAAAADTSDEQNLDLSRFFTVIEGHRLEPGMSFNEVMSLGFRPARAIEEYDYNRTSTHVHMRVEYIGGISDPELAVLNNLDITLTFITHAPREDVASVTQGYLAGVLIGGPISETTLSLRAADLGGEYTRLDLSMEMAARLNFSSTLDDVIAQWGEPSRRADTSPLSTIWYEDDNTEIRVEQRNSDGVVYVFQWTVQQAVLRSLGIEF